MKIVCIAHKGARVYVYVWINFPKIIIQYSE